MTITNTCWKHQYSLQITNLHYISYYLCPVCNNLIITSRFHHRQTPHSSYLSTHLYSIHSINHPITQSLPSKITEKPSSQINIRHQSFCRHLTASLTPRHAAIVVDKQNDEHGECPSVSAATLSNLHHNHQCPDSPLSPTVLLWRKKDAKSFCSPGFKVLRWSAVNPGWDLS